MSNYRVDFKLIRPNSKLNRKAFTFTIADNAIEAARKVIDGHATETLKILNVSKVA